MNERIVRFKANAAVKDIVGRGLIYDDNIAIIELVKNAKDARSPKAIIKFKDEVQLSDNSSLIILDFGRGMTLDDIRNKWLNIAYSEKKGKLLNGQNNVAYAGNKGVGRFSCDRLGKELILYTKVTNGDFIKLPINWELFENKGQDDEISTIPLEYQILDKNTFLREVGEDFFEHGTILVIKRLRSEWGTKKLAKLVSELEKFSPSLDDDFEVHLHSEAQAHQNDKNLASKLNKKINNNILDKLVFKTTYIKSSIDKDGLSINTTLYYQGKEIYTYTAANPYTLVKNVKAEVHYLDPLSKSYFTKNTGVTPNNYGSVFLFYNGFRISPYGNAKNDWLGLDQRKSQGTARYLGTRDVFGRIDISDHDDAFSVITSREGLANNKAFTELIAFDQDEKISLSSGKFGYGYITTIIRQLENFVVSGLDWNSLIDRLDPDKKRVITDTDIQKDPSRYQLKAISEDNVREACNRILKSDVKIIDFKINEGLILELTQIANEKYRQFVEDFVEKTGDKSFNNLSTREKGFVKQIVAEEQGKTKAALEEKAYAEKQRQVAEERAETEKRRSNFLEELASPEKTLDALITHVMKQISGGIEKDIKSILALYYKSPDQVTKEELVEALEHVVIDVSLIKETATMATKADFNLKVASIKEDMFAFLEDYIKQIASKEKKWGLKIHFNNSQNLEEIRTFQPAKLCVFLVNILDNARKINAKNFYVNCSHKKITFVDDGDGFDFGTYSPDDFFRKGVSTTDGGSGLGLYHCKKLATGFNAKISIANDPDVGGASISLELN